MAFRYALKACRNGCDADELITTNKIGSAYAKEQILKILKKYDGQLFLIYLLGYGAGRFWIEGLRTDQLLILGTQVAVSQVLSATVAIAAAVIMIVMFKKKKDAK